MLVSFGHVFTCVWLVWSASGSVLSGCFFFKQKTAYEMRISDCSSDVCSAELVSRLEGLYTETLGNNKVEIIRERATVAGPHEVLLGSGQTITAGKILIATGAWPIVPHFPGAEHGITSNEVFHLDTFPKRVVIAGAGYNANEFGGDFHQFGAHVGS